MNFAGTGAATKVDRIVDELASSIVAGTYPAGTRLPPLQQLADMHETTVPTLQRVVARLEAMSLVAGRKGSGFTVLNTDRCGGPDLFAILIRNAPRDPEAAAAALADLLELRRWIASGLLRKFARRIPEALAPALQTLLSDFVAAAEQPADTSELSRIEHELLRTLVAAAEQRAALAIVNILEQVMAQSAELQQAVYSDPQQTVHIWQAIIAALDNPPVLLQLRTNLEEILTGFDEALVARFREIAFGVATHKTADLPS